MPTRSELSVAGIRLYDRVAEETNGILGSKMLNKTTGITVSISDYEDVSSQSKQETPTLLTQHKGSALGAEVSVFELNTEINKACRFSSLMLGKRIIYRLSRLPLEEVSSFEPTAYKICDEIDSNGVIDSSSLRESIQQYVRDVKRYFDTESSLKGHMSMDVQTQRLDEVKAQLATALDYKGVKDEHMESMHESQQNIQAKQAELKEELARLAEEDQKLEASIAKGKLKQYEQNNIVLSLEAELTEIQTSAVINEQELVAFKKMRDLLEETRSEFKTMKWAP